MIDNNLPLVQTVISFKRGRQRASDTPFKKKGFAIFLTFVYFWYDCVVITWMGVMYWLTMPSMIEGRAASMADLQISSGMSSESEEQIWKESCYKYDIRQHS